MTDGSAVSASQALDGTIELVSAFVSNSNTRLSAEELQALIRDTYATLSGLSMHSTAIAEVAASETSPKSKAEIKKSIGPDNLISFEDGKAYKSLKRHLNSRGLTPHAYREKYGLPADYPMTHPAYSARRSELAKSIGLGSKGRTAKAALGKKARPAKTPA